MQRVKRSTAVAVLPADPAGGTPGYFPQPNPGGGVPAAVPGYEWYNNVQEEIVSIIAAAGIALDGSARNQMLLALRAAGVFTTPAQFDNTTKAATTAWVQARGAAFGGQAIMSSAGAIPVASMGKEITFTAAGTYTVPAASSVPSGTVILLIATAAGVTIARTGTDVFATETSSSVTSVAIGVADTLMLMSDSSGVWLMVGGSVQLGYSASFASLLAPNGFGRIPSGIFIQGGAWVSSATAGDGVGVTFPTAFPTACIAVAPTTNLATTSNSAAWIDTLTAGGFKGHSVATSAVCLYLALGY